MSKSVLKSALALLVATLAIVCALGAGATPAYAHAIVVRTEPADGAVLGGPPQQLRLWFSEPVALGFTTFALIDSSGKQIAVTAHSDAASTALAVRNEGVSAAEVILDLPALPPSVYRLSWTALSNADLHNTVGSIVFGVQRATDGATAAAAEPVPSPIELALRWLNFGALAALIGALALALLALPGATNHEPRTTNDEPRTTNDEQKGKQADWQIIATQSRARLLQLARWSAGLALLAGLGLLLAQAVSIGAATGQNVVASAWALAGGTSYGLYWLLRQALLLLLFVTLMLGMKYPARTSTTLFSIFTATFAILLVISQALQGHATAFAELSLLRVLADMLHLLAAGIWVGGLLALAVAIVPLLRAGSEQIALAWGILRRFGGLAAASLAALLITGLFMSGQQVASLDALLTTLYGRALLLKIVLIAIVALIGLCNAAALHPRVAGRLGWLLRRPAGWSPFKRIGLGRMVLLETIGASVVLLLAAFLSAAQPARGPAFDPPATETPATATAHADDLIVTLALKPNRPGQNFVTLGVFDTRRPAPAPIGEVAVQLMSPGTQNIARLVASPLGKGRYEVIDDSIAGADDMSIVVTVRRAGLPDAIATLPWTVLPVAQQPRVVLVSNSPLAPWADRAALAIALLLGMLVVAGWLWRLVPHVPFIKTIKSGVAARRLRPLRKD